MPTTAEYIAQIADLGDLGELVREKVDMVDPQLSGDDALKHFGYTGGDTPEEAGKFLGEKRALLEGRFGDLEVLGHKPKKKTLVANDKLLEKLDLLLEIDTATKVRGLITGEMKDLVQPPTVLTKLDDAAEKVDNAAEAVTNALTGRKLAELEQGLKDFDAAHEQLAKEFGAVKHKALKKHLTEVLSAAGNAFSLGETYRTAKTAVENKVSTRLGFAWNDALEIAGNSFEYFTGKIGKKMPLSSAVKIDPSFGKALEEIDQKSAKGEDVGEAKAKASKLGEETLKTLDGMPTKLKEAEPSFFGRLNSTVWGIVTSLKS